MSTIKLKIVGTNEDGSFNCEIIGNKINGSLGVQGDLQVLDNNGEGNAVITFTQAGEIGTPNVNITPDGEIIAKKLNVEGKAEFGNDVTVVGKVSAESFE